MKNNELLINDPNAISYLSGLIVEGDKYLVLRSSSRRGFAKEGYYFPGCKGSKVVANAKQLKDQLYLKYRLKVYVDRKIGDVMIKTGVQTYGALELYLCFLNGKSSMSTLGVIPTLFTKEEMQKLPFSKADAYLVKRIAVFDKVYRGLKRVTPLSEREEKQCLLLYKSLLDHKKRIFTNDIQDFALLITSETTLDEIITAYIFIAKRAKISFKRYLRVVKNLEIYEGKKL